MAGELVVRNPREFRGFYFDKGVKVDDWLPIGNYLVGARLMLSFKDGTRATVYSLVPANKPSGRWYVEPKVVEQRG